MYLERPVTRNSKPRPRVSLSRQLLIFQFSLLAIVLLAVSATSIQQSQLNFNRDQQRRLLAVAEYSAAYPVVRFKLSADTAAVLSVQIESLRTTSGVDALIITDPDGRVLASPEDPRLMRATVLVPDEQAELARGWSGVAEIGSTTFVAARAPVLNDDGELVGVVIAANRYPTLQEMIARSAPDLLTYLGVAGVVGVLGSLWLARRMKRQTLGLEPVEIARLVEHREAMVHGIREGIIAVDSDGYISLANDSARHLLGLPHDAQGRHISDVGLDTRTVDALTSDGVADVDSLLVNRGVLLALNQTTIHPARSSPEVVTTLRDRTELVALQHELGSSQQTTDTLRAQAHEFANRLHTISMLIQLGDPEVAVDYINAVSRDSTKSYEDVIGKIGDPTVAAVLIAKMSLARERGAELVLTADSELPRVDEELSADIVTVLGNLIDNALDAVAAGPDRSVTIGVHDVRTDDGHEVRIVVGDSGPGVDSGIIDRMFEPGVSSKPTGDVDSARGFGLAIVNLVATRRGGSIALSSEAGAKFDVVLPAKDGSYV